MIVFTHTRPKSSHVSFSMVLMTIYGSPKRTGAYKKGWRCEIKRNGRGSTTATAKNATNYQLTHLLEYPHKKRGHKGIVQPKKHIQPAADKWQAEFEHRCEEACKAK